jgi:hypothetical protein
MTAIQRFTSAVLALALVCSVGTGKDKTETFPVGKDGSLVMELDVGEIKISGWDKNEVLVKATGIDERDMEYLTMSKSGEAVLVEFDPRNGRSDRARFTVNVPSRFDVDVSTAGGRITIDAPLNGSISGTTAGGEIRIGDIGGEITMTTAGGEIEAGKITGDVDLTTAGGNVKTADVSGMADISTAGGNITTGDIGGSLQARTAGGNITAGQVAKKLTASTAGGNIIIEGTQSKASLSTAGGNIDLGAAKGRVDAKTAGGDLTLKSIVGSVSGKTAGGDIVVDLNPIGTGSSSLATAGGDITLFLPADAKATISARIKGDDSRGDEPPEYEIRSDFGPVTLEEGGRRGEIRATLKINGGGTPIRLETSMGDIMVKKAEKK